MNDLSLHILDILQNSVSAGAYEIRLIVEEDPESDRLTVSIIDNGKGMSGDQLERVSDPFFTSRTTRRVGLGIPLFKQTCRECGGDLTITSQLGKGTSVTAVMGYSHIDRPPLGDVSNILVLTIISNPEINFIFTYIYRKREFIFISSEVNDIITDILSGNNQMIKLLTEYLNNNISELKT